MTVPTSPPAAWYADPDGSGGQRYWDGDGWTRHRRTEALTAPSGVAANVSGRWAALPPALKVALPIVVVLALVGTGFAVLGKGSGDNWSALPKRLTCQTQDGPTPPDNFAIASVEASHPRGSVLQLTVRFAKPLPQPPTGTHAAGFVGYILSYGVANNGKKFADLGPEQDTSDLAISSTRTDNVAEARMRPDRDTEARLTAPDTVQITLDLKRFGIESQTVLPSLTLDSQFNTPSITTVQFATQACS